MRVLITGGAGYIGSHCAKLFKRAGHDVIVLDNFERGNREAVGRGEQIEVDLLDREALFPAIVAAEVDAVVHFAALAYVGESMQHPDRIAARRVGDPAELVADAGLARSVLGGSPRYSDLHDSVRHAWGWFDHA